MHTTSVDHDGIMSLDTSGPYQTRSNYLVLGAHSLHVSGAEA